MGESFIIDLTKCSPFVKQIMIGRGAPKSFFRFDQTLDEHSIITSMHEQRKPIHYSTQLSSYQRCWDHPQGSWWLIIGSETDEDKAIVCALGLMQQASLHYAKSPAINHRPLFWNLYGGEYDKLRQRDDFRSSVGGIGMLIISNLAINSSLSKIEKCRDLLRMYSDIPRVVTIAGSDPLKFAIEQLHMSPTRVLNLGRKIRTRQI